MRKALQASTRGRNDIQARSLRCCRSAAARAGSQSIRTHADLQAQHRRPEQARFAPEHPSSSPVRPAQQPHSSSSRLVTPAAAHAAATRTPLQAPFVQPSSHTNISMPLGPIDLYGNYSVQGPAIIRKVANALVAVVQPGGAVQLLQSASDGPVVMSGASLSHDDDEAAVVALMGRHLELGGLYTMDNDREGLVHDDKTIISLHHLSEGNTITLLPGGSCSHPVNCHPH